MGLWEKRIELKNGSPLSAVPRIIPILRITENKGLDTVPSIFVWRNSLRLRMRFDIDIDTIAKMPLLSLEIRFLSAGRWETLCRVGHDFQRYGQKVVSKKRYGVKPYKHIKIFLEFSHNSLRRAKKNAGETEGIIVKT